tara:strand:- start:9409 stop:10728 length:1320 start_codon:yes stop_codon:yes gene_type:complete
MYQGRPSIDRWNPHVVWGLNKFEELDLGMMGGLSLFKDEAEAVKAKYDQFIEKYERAMASVMALHPDVHENIHNTLPESLVVDGGGHHHHIPWLPLAYRLSPQLSPVQKLADDKIKAAKFGGIPDIGMWLGSGTFKYDSFEAQENYRAREAKKANKTYQRKKNPHKKLRLNVILENNWPRCSCCHNYMKFVGQMGFPEWQLAIHMATYHVLPPLYGKKHKDKSVSHMKYYQRSGLGSGEFCGVDSHPTHTKWFTFFYCGCSHYDHPAGHDACVVFTHRYKPHSLDNDIKPRKGRWTKRRYIDGVEKFMRKHKIHPDVIENDEPSAVALQFIEGWELGFDFDYWECLPDALADAIWDCGDVLPKDVFGNATSFSLFGAPSSQQEPWIYRCPMGFDTPHRMAPIISWTDEHHDMTHQMYGCFGCKGQETDTIWCLLDNSCT